MPIYRLKASNRQERVSIMRQESHSDKSDALGPIGDQHVPIDYIWATGEQARLRAMSLYLIRSIVESHGGSIEVDLATDTINIDVPEEEESACSLEIEEQVGRMCH